MRKSFMLAVLGVAGAAASATPAAAWSYGFRPAQPHTTLAAFPAVRPPGWYANRYYYQWPIPWFAYYGYQDGPYANWMAGGGYAYYAGLGDNQPNPPYPGYVGGPQYGAHHGAGANGGGHGMGMAAATSGEATVVITLPADARLAFNGVPAAATGATRTFKTPVLEAGREYEYTLTAEGLVDGQVKKTTKRVVVRPGERVEVTLTPGEEK
ncbi:MAG: TIGR03000 domain-containing protein [Gemmataceae bacterium]|nr:TIGR03000 domain-containing protein [Gemmataceae bacterium]